MLHRQERSYAVRLVRPFLAPLRRSGRVPAQGLDALEKLDPDDRIPISVVHQMLEEAVRLADDPNIGLEAAREYSPGDTGALDYVVSSAPTVRGALEVAARYMRLVNDALALRVDETAGRVAIRFETAAQPPRASVDFMLGAFHRVHAGVWARATGAKVTVFFPYPAPPSLDEHTRTFGGAELRFSAPFTGYVFEGAVLDAPLESADSKLHDVIRKHAEAVLAALPRADSVTERVRAVVNAELPSGAPSVASVALKLHMSPRTLERRLQGEGTTFSALVDELRRELAFRYVGSTTTDLSEVALLLGFSQTSAFHRAFKRWTNETPLHYRRAHAQVWQGPKPQP
ncbi:MAG TPA: AraC family transcriptional regulator [Polyangiaceae bacterium]|nr:AraC family transcriptional regulator [Polyangiaceae bacterium]